MKLQVMSGPRAFPLTDVRHFIVPGRGRSRGRAQLNLITLDRVDFASELVAGKVISDSATILCSGGWSPGEVGAHGPLPRELPQDDRADSEAALMRDAFLARGVPANMLDIEDESVDSVTNLVFAERFGHIRPGAKVAIVAQREHLARFIRLIAPKVLHHDYVGLAAPEIHSRDTDALGARLATRWILHGLGPDSPNLDQITYDRAVKVWRLVNRCGGGRRYSAGLDRVI